MPVQLDIVEDGAFVTLVGWGTLTDEEFHHIIEDFFQSEERVRCLRRWLSDWTRVERVEVSTATLKRIAAITVRALQSVGSFGHVAIVGRSEIMYGLSRMWEVYFEHSGWQTQVFREREQALRWLHEAPPRARTL
jgi:hypothetical protein